MFRLRLAHRRRGFVGLIVEIIAMLAGNALAQLAFDAGEQAVLFGGNEDQRVARVAGSTSAADAVNIFFGRFGTSKLTT